MIFRDFTVEPDWIGVGGAEKSEKCRNVVPVVVSKSGASGGV